MPEKMPARLFSIYFIICPRKEYRLYRTKIVRVLRSQIFCQIVQKFCRHTDVCKEITVQDDGKDASKTRTKPLRVPLKTALKRENEIAASDTRKADEAGLAPG